MSFAIVLNLADENLPWTHHSKVLALAIKPALDALVMEDQLFLRLHRGVKSLYQSGVRYREEPPTTVQFNDGRITNIEEFASLSVVLARGWGDCDDLAPWRCAELRNKGEKASIRLQWRKQPNGRKLYHVVVRRPKGVKDFDPRYMVRTPDGSIVEDPSRALGMPSSYTTMYRDAHL